MASLASVPTILRCASLSAFLGFYGLTAAVGAPPNVTALFPAGGRIGQTVEVTAQGSLGDKPQAWVSRDGLKVEFPESGNKFKVSVAEQAPSGVCWIRFFNAEGASSLRPFVIGTLAEVNEKEPNNSAKDAQKLETSQVIVNGVLEKNGDVDTFAVPMKTGQTLVASLTAKQTLGSPMDGVLQVLGPSGFVMEHNDDDHGLDPQIVFTAPSDGEYGVRIFAFPEQPNSSIQFAGGANYIYRLTLTTGAFVDHAEPMSVMRSAISGEAAPPQRLRLFGWNLPIELSDFPITAADSQADSFIVRHSLLSNVLTLPIESHPSLVEIEPAEPSAPLQELALPSSMTGVIGKPGDEDYFRIKLAAKQAIILRTDARSAGSPLDPVLRILKPDGSQLQEIDDGAKGDFDPDANFTAPAEGEYRIVIADRFGQGGPRFFYRLTALPSSPDFELRVAADAFILKDDKPLEIPLTIDRQRAFAGELEISVSGLPEHVTSERVVSMKDGETSKAVKLLIKAEPGVKFSGPIQIQGRTRSEPMVTKLASPPPPTVTGTPRDVWLTVIAAAK